MPKQTIPIAKIRGRALAEVVVDTRAIDHLMPRLRPGSKETRALLDAIGLLYMAFIRRRFQTYSRGGGDWPPLSPFTVAAKGSNILLIDLGVLRRALSPGAPGSTFRVLKDRVIVGVGEPAPHPNGEGAATIADIMLFHQTGRGVPAREILVVPDGKTTTTMMRRAGSAVSQLMRQAEQRGRA